MRPSMRRADSGSRMICAGILLAGCIATELGAQRADASQQSKAMQGEGAKPAAIRASGFDSVSLLRRDWTGSMKSRWALTLHPHKNGRHAMLEGWDRWTAKNARLKTVRMDLPFIRCGSIVVLNRRDFLVSGSSVDAQGKLSRGHLMLLRLHEGDPAHFQVLASKLYNGIDANVVRWNRAEGRLYVHDLTKERLLCARWPGRRASNYLPEEAAFEQILDSKSCSALRYTDSMVAYCPRWDTGIVVATLTHVRLEAGKWMVGGTRSFESYDKLQPDRVDVVRRARFTVLPFLTTDDKGQSTQTGTLEVASNPSHKPSLLRWVDDASGMAVAMAMPFQRLGSMQDIGEDLFLLAGSSVDEKGLVTAGHILVVRVTPWGLRRFEVLDQRQYPGVDTFACVFNTTDSHLYILDAQARRIYSAPFSGIGKGSKLPEPGDLIPIADGKSVPALEEALGRNLHVPKGLSGVNLTEGAEAYWLVQQDRRWQVKPPRPVRQLPKPSNPRNR